jgi:hypothetical protein
LAVKQGFVPTVRLVTVTGREHVKVTLDMSDQPPLRPSESLVSSGALDNKGTTRGRAASGTSSPLLVPSVVATAAFAVATGTFAWLALNAKHRFEVQLDTFQNSKTPIENSRSNMKTYGYLTDAFGAATIISGSVALYLALTSNSSPGKPKESSSNRSVVLAPTLGGMAVHGSW